MTALAKNPYLTCTGNLNSQKYPPGSISKIEVKGELIGDLIKNAMAQVTFIEYTGETVVSTGRASELDSDANYKPRKYLNHIRFDLGKLTDAKDFSQFWPSDTCQIELLIPKNAIYNTSSFKAPTQIHCDQSGGVTTLNCSLQ